MSYIGRVYQGSVPCFAFVADVLRDQGVELPGYEYAPAEHAEALRRHLFEHGEPVTTPQRGDVVLLNQGGQAAHIGIMLEPPLFMHHTVSHGVVIERTTAFHWRNRVAGYFRPRLPESAEG